ncbi:streptolysin S family TOMM toxin [Clostridium tarantellae]|uniref:Streptolysin S family bacteriocin n=1 Tax=Clostridium tarantellae TaxID=39493 RepID=A0A6I1MI79_9CLOT|nr:streptolysin S family TOMM toxin [Clostridium tarantellae]MPQ43075.1 streptolysin S family bacteriocin [Clostridium tarantellae]
MLKFNNNILATTIVNKEIKVIPGACCCCTCCCCVGVNIGSGSVGTNVNPQNAE